MVSNKVVRGGGGGRGRWTHKRTNSNKSKQVKKTIRSGNYLKKKKDYTLFMQIKSWTNKE